MCCEKPTDPLSIALILLALMPSSCFQFMSHFLQAFECLFEWVKSTVDKSHLRRRGDRIPSVGFYLKTRENFVCLWYVGVYVYVYLCLYVYIQYVCLQSMNQYIDRWVSQLNMKHGVSLLCPGVSNTLLSNKPSGIFLLCTKRITVWVSFDVCEWEAMNPCVWVHPELMS